MAATLRHSAAKRFTDRSAAITRRLHSAISTTHPLHDTPGPPPVPEPEPQNRNARLDSCNAPPLARLPTSSLLRALMLHTVTSSPTLLGLGTALMLRAADKVDRIPPLKWLVDKTFYV